MGIDSMIRGINGQKQSISRPASSKSTLGLPPEIYGGDTETILTKDDATGDGNRVSFLRVPESPDFRRPSTADVVLEKLQVERMDGGGLSISGVAIVANCHFSLMIFGGFFLLAGIVLSYIGYGTAVKNYPEAQPVGAPKGTFEKSNTHQQMQIVGPIFIVVGGIMMLLGVAMFAVHYKVHKDEKERRLARSAVQICQLENNFSQSHLTGTPIHTMMPNQGHPILSLRRGSWWMEPTPIEEPQTPSQSLDTTTEYNISPTPSPRNERNFQQNSPMQHSEYRHQQKPSITISFPLSPGQGDICTFPEDCSSIASFPVGVQSVQNEKHCTIDKPLPEADDCCNPDANNQQPMAIEETSTPNTPNTLPDFGETMHFQNRGQVPRMQIGSGILNRVTPSYENTKKLLVNETSSTKNLPLSKNGVALPRLSRHSIRTPETYSSNRTEPGQKSEGYTSLQD